MTLDQMGSWQLDGDLNNLTNYKEDPFTCGSSRTFNYINLVTGMSQMTKKDHTEICVRWKMMIDCFKVGSKASLYIISTVH